MIEEYRALGIPHFLIDSDGQVDALIPCWVNSGFDILFPVEVGAWEGDPRAIRRQYGRALRLMGGVNKHIIPLGESAIRAHLEALRPLARDGGYLPLPDHRIPPDCSFAQFCTYIRVYKQVFNGAGE
jgi:uroporphyrinogen decarboxylase